MKNVVVSLCAAAGLAAVASAAPTLTVNAGFGTNGWLAPGSSSFLTTGNTERGMAYNPATGNLVLVSRAGGNNARILSGSTGADQGALNLGSGVISGGTFQVNQIGISDDGQIYVANLTTICNANSTNASKTPLKIYRWANESSVIDSSPWFNGYLTSGAGAAVSLRVGDSMDVAGSGSTARVVMGHGNNAALSGYSIFEGGVATSVTSFSPSLTGSKFRLGVTFGATNNDVIGKVTSDSLYSTSFSGTAGSFNATGALTGAGESAIDHVTINGVNYLASLDMNNSTVRIYDMTNPAAPTLIASANATTGTLTGNANATGSVKFGAVDQVNMTATVYAMCSNQGISSYTFTVPTPGSASLLAVGGLVACRRRRR